MSQPIRYKLEANHWAHESTEKYRVVKYKILSGPDESGRYEVQEGRQCSREVHGDWLFSSPAEAIENERKRLRESYERELKALGAVKMRAKP